MEFAAAFCYPNSDPPTPPLLVVVPSIDFVIICLPSSPLADILCSPVPLSTAVYHTVVTGPPSCTPSQGIASAGEGLPRGGGGQPLFPSTPCWQGLLSGRPFRQLDGTRLFFAVVGPKWAQIWGGGYRNLTRPETGRKNSSISTDPDP